MGGVKEHMEVVEEVEITETKMIPMDRTPLDNLRELLDDIEEQVEKVRSDVLVLVDEKEDIQNTLEMLTSPDQLEGLDGADREEVEATVERLSQRLNAVTVGISTVRTSAQQESLHHVNRAIDTLIFQIQTDTIQASMMCRQYLSAAGTEIATVPDSKFESHLMGCTAEDQKTVRKRLLGLLDHIKVIVKESIEETS